MNSKIIIPILIYILLLIIAITAIIYFYYYNPFEQKKSSINSYAKIQSNIDKLHIKEQKVQTESVETKDLTDDAKIRDEKSEKITQGKKELTFEDKKNEDKKVMEKKFQSQAQDKKVSAGKTAETKFTNTPVKEVYSKGSSLPDQSFDSYGEYISQEEYNYRVALIKNLILKTVIIDKLTKGNGISQEFFKVVYIDKMIPAKILEDLVESKEFRNLIPEKYQKDEIKLKGLAKGEKIVFKNQNIKNLLILWSQGRLTPIQKAWKVKAEK